jgi:hypothetical protein
MSYERLSEYGKQCIDKFQEDESIYIINYVEKLDHDGYDDQGPKSNLWDLYVLYTNSVNGEYVIEYVNWYHWENCFLKDTKKEYQLYETFNMNNVRSTPESSRKIIEHELIKLFGYY